MSNRNTGGPAFPSQGQNEFGMTVMPGDEGMTLRDYFAAKAMQGYIACGGMTEPLEGAVRPFNEVEIASGSYAVADAMLKARES